MADSDYLVKKLWSYCNVLRDDGLSYQDYLEQLTFLLFLKMADERAELVEGKHPIPKGYRWTDLAAPQMVGVKLEEHYRDTLRYLGAWGVETAHTDGGVSLESTRESMKVGSLFLRLFRGNVASPAARPD